MLINCNRTVAIAKIENCYCNDKRRRLSHKHNN